MQGKDTEWEDDPHNTDMAHTHIHGSLCSICVHQYEQMPFHTERWKFSCGRKQLHFHSVNWNLAVNSTPTSCLTWSFFICITWFLFDAQYLYVQQILTKLQSNHFMARCFHHHVVLYIACTTAKPSQDWASATIVLPQYLLNWMSAHGPK